MNTHDDYISSQRQKRVTQQRHLDDAEEQIRAARSAHVDLMTRQGQLIGEEKVSSYSTIQLFSPSPYS